MVWILGRLHIHLRPHPPRWTLHPYRPFHYRYHLSHLTLHRLTLHACQHYRFVLMSNPLTPALPLCVQCN